MVSQALGKNLSLLPTSARVPFYNSLIRPIFDYANIVWGVPHCPHERCTPSTKQGCQKFIMDRPFQLSIYPFSVHSKLWAGLPWINEARAFPQVPLRLYKCVNEIAAHSSDFLANKNVHDNNTRQRDCRPKIERTGKKQRTHHHTVKDCNNLDLSIRNSNNIATFKRNFLNQF